MIQINTIYNGDCLDLMNNIQDKSIDMILCDLPYGTTACKWDVVIPFEPLWKEYKRIIKDNGAIVLFGSEPFSSYLRISNIKNYKYEWYWRKNLPTNFLNAKRQPLRAIETISVFNSSFYFPILENKPKENIRTNNKIYKQTNEGVYGKINDNYPKFQNREIPLDKNYPNNIINIDIEHRIFRVHPTQKPVALFEYLIKTYTNENETVLDNCSGSGTTAIACINTNRNYICMEKEKKYYDISVDRTNKHKQQYKLL